MKRELSILVCCTLVTGASQAQDTLQLQEFQIIDTLAVNVGASYVQRFDSLNAPSAMPALNLTDVLQTRGGVSFKNYGPGLLSTPTFRGGDANHTQVTWNGMKLNSPMLGTMDMSTLPVSQFDQLALRSGVSSSLYSSGGMGSLISIQQSADLTNESARLLLGGGSFGTFHSAVKFNLPVTLLGRPSAIAFNADVQAVENNFPYTNISADPWREDVLQNADFSRSNFSFSLISRITSHLEVEAIGWLSETQRNIPSTINSPPRFSEQSDASQKAFVRVRSEHEKWSWSLRSMVEQNDNAYTDRALAIDNLNRYQSVQNQLESSVKLRPWLTAFSRLGYDRIKAVSGNYSQTHSADQWSALGVMRSSLWTGRVRLDLGGRYESFLQHSKALPFAGINIKPIKGAGLGLTASASKTVRFPTLNELYWVPGGTSDLLPENGTTYEAGLEWMNERTNLTVVAYSSDYTNRIRWLPQGSIFRPVNVDEAQIEGIDVNAGHSIGTKSKSLQLEVAYHLTNAQGRNSGDEFAALTFVPRHSSALNATACLKEFSFHAQHQWMGRRFITNDELEYMPAYHIASFGAGYSFNTTAAMQMNLSIWVHNALDWQYQNMPWRPMPGRNFHLKLDLRWRKR
ncbi:MAG: TonB-dependent receptor [Cryomorphaceae bacterium]